MQLVKMDQVIEVGNGNLLTPKGFTTAGYHAGLRYSKKDMGVIFSEVPAASAAVYTTNQFQAAPLKVTQDSIAREGLVLRTISSFFFVL